MNSISLTGHIANDIEVKQTKSNIAVTEFSVAVKRLGTKEPTTDFILVQAWRQQADFIGKYFKKGDPIEVQGQLVSSKYEKDGRTVTKWYVSADRVGFVPSRKQSQEGSKPAEDEPHFEDVTSSEDLPF